MRTTQIKSRAGVWAEQVGTTATESLPRHESVENEKLIVVKVEEEEDIEDSLEVVIDGLSNLSLQE